MIQEKIKENYLEGSGLLVGTTTFYDVLSPAFSGFVIRSDICVAVTIL